MKIAVMQPYTFPYLGYFQLVNAVDTFVFCDDVNYIKGGWINRNKILFLNKARLITFPCIKASPNKLIKDIEIQISSKFYRNALLTIKQTYKKAPYFDLVYPLIESIINSESKNISEFASNSVIKISNYLELPKIYMYTSNHFSHTKGQDKSDRLISITKELGGNHYINAIGGRELYDKPYFQSHGVLLHFLEAQIKPYKQFENDFVPSLSMIDVLMFNSIEETKLLLSQYELV